MLAAAAATTTTSSSSFGTGQVLYSILWFALLFVEVWLQVSIFIDIFRSHDLKGWQKALWVLLVLLLPLIGILVYFIARGDKMRAHQMEAEKSEQSFFAQNMPQAADRSQSKAEQLDRLAALRDKGDISAEQYRQLRDEIINGGPGSSGAGTNA
jgi:glucan phosphoethanolaminetransferase (alkaline phosphatase superfamily)